MKKYIQIYNYSNQLKARMAIYNLSGKADIWWQDLKRVKGIKEKNVNWSTFKTQFKKKLCLSSTMKREQRNSMSLN